MEGGVACNTVLLGGQALAAELKMVVDAAVGWENALRVADWLEPLYLPFSSLYHLVGVVQSGRFMGSTKSGLSRVNQGIPRFACKPDLDHA